ncbi:MAG: general secretion pathway protein GspB [Gammaproteobacteria bacterium]|nr:general secretion pathway protein GspB [Gammaproteobacteria bacterium]
MSTILDALKKSEQERKKNHVPTLSDMPVPEESARWPLYVIAALSLTLACLVGVLIANWYGPNRSVPQADEAKPLIKSDAANQQIVEADLADVVVNVVSYSLDSSQRFVMLDGKIYRENDFVRAGLRVDEIKPNAVVLNFRGELLTRTP